MAGQNSIRMMVRVALIPLFMQKVLIGTSLAGEAKHSQEQCNATMLIKL
jgi:hypothetical protein